MAGDPERHPGQALLVALRDRWLHRPRQPDQELRPRVEPERRVAGDDAQADHTAPLARHDGLLEDDEVASRPEWNERVGTGGDPVSAHLQALDPRATQAVGRDEDPLGVDVAAGDRDAAQLDAARAAARRVVAQRPAGVVGTRERTRAAAGEQLPSSIPYLGDPASERRVREGEGRKHRHSDEQAPAHNRMVAQKTRQGWAAFTQCGPPQLRSYG